MHLGHAFREHEPPDRFFDRAADGEGAVVAQDAQLVVAERRRDPLAAVAVVGERTFWWVRLGLKRDPQKLERVLSAMENGDFKTASAEETAANAGAAPVDLSSLTRRKVKLVAPPFVHAHDQVATVGPQIVEFEMRIVEKEIQVDEDAWLQAFTYNGSTPGPMTTLRPTFTSSGMTTRLPTMVIPVLTMSGRSKFAMLLSP